jgi:hypothetical protein
VCLIRIAAVVRGKPRNSQSLIHLSLISPLRFTSSGFFISSAGFLFLFYTTFMARTQCLRSRLRGAAVLPFLLKLPGFT